MAISFLIYTFFDLGPPIQEHNYGAKWGLGIHVPFFDLGPPIQEHNCGAKRELGIHVPIT